MPIPRSEIFDPEQAGLYHCISRCVRRGFLCGGRNGKYEHRRQWLETRLRELAELFAIDVVAYAVMSNHMHVLLWTDPQRAATWEPRDVAGRWLTLFPGPALSEDDDPEERINLLAADPERIKELRGRLSSLSWFNRCLKEPVSRRANKEDNCSGAFWEGRFKSHRVVDKAGALSCAVYIDLNVIRAGQAKTPEDSDHTSVKERIAVRQQTRPRRRKIASQLPRGSQRKSKSVTRRDRSAHAEDGLWLAPLSAEGSRRSGRRNLLGIGVDAYLKLVDAVGRQVCSGKLGSIPKSLMPILERLEHDVDSWLAVMKCKLDDLWGTTIGTEAALIAEAERRGRRWVVNPLENRA